MGNLIQFSAILISILGVFVTLFITMLKFNRNSVTKDDLNNSIESLHSEMNKRFEEVNKRLDEATADRARIEKEAAADRQKIRDEAVANRQEIKAEMSSGFAQARDERKEIRGKSFVKIRITLSTWRTITHQKPILFRKRMTALDCGRAS